MGPRRARRAKAIRQKTLWLCFPMVHNTGMASGKKRFNSKMPSRGIGMYAIVFRNGFVVDGTGKKGFNADVAVHNGRIAAVGTIPPGAGAEEYDISGMAITPGFIDMHSHSDIVALSEPELLPKVMQGITSELLGQDGIGPAPLPDDPAVISSWRSYLAGLAGNPPLEWTWRSLNDYAEALEKAPRGCNLLPLLPQGNVRMRIMGLEDREAGEDDIRAMEKEVDQGMAAGAWGISLGMVYMPCIFSRHEELVRILARAAKAGGFLVVHMRNGSTLLLESLEELFGISDEAGIPLHVSHFKAAGKANWHKMGQALAMLEQRQAAGGDVSFDIYPYTAASTMFTILLPPWVLEGGMQATLERLRQQEIREKIIGEWTNPVKPTMQSKGWDNPVHLNGWNNILVSSARSGNDRIVGKRMTEIAAERAVSPELAAFQLMEEEQGDMGVIYFNMDEDRVAEGIRHPLGMLCTDGLLGGTPHPRVYGSFPRVLARYVRERAELSLEEAVHKMTGKPAARLGLKARGLLMPGFAADLVVFDAGSIQDTATYEAPRQFPQGIAHVVVNGEHTVKEGSFTGKLGGRVLRRAPAAEQQ